MADEVRLFIATIPAGTTQAAPAVVPLTMPARRVDRIDWRVPAGSQGMMGWALTMGGVQVLPTAGTPWVTGEGISGTWTVEGLPDSGAWQLTGYNTGLFPHAVYLDFHLTVPRPRYRPPTRLAPADLAMVGDLSAAGPPVAPPP